MKTVIDPNSHESVLKEWRGSHAQIWAFHISRKRTAISLSRKGEQEALYIVGIACEHFSGPFRWDQAEISIFADPPNQWGEVRRHIVDKKASFELLCCDVAIVRGAASVPIDPFDDFIGGANK